LVVSGKLGEQNVRPRSKTQPGKAGGPSAVFGIEKYFSIFLVHIEVVGFAVDIQK
jgi:hypothetical protein